MKSIHKVVAGTLLAGGVLASAATVFTIAHADETVAVAPAAGPHGGPWHHHHGGPGRLYSKLGLTTEQQASMKAIWTASKPEMQSMHETMRANHLKLAQIKPDDPNYANVVAEVAQSNAALAAKRTSQMAELRAQMYAVLTQPQKTQLATLEAQMAANHRGPATPAAE
jgi:Spy/CpxP family protein refolding chaperone